MTGIARQVYFFLIGGGGGSLDPVGCAPGEGVAAGGGEVGLGGGGGAVSVGLGGGGGGRVGRDGGSFPAACPPVVAPVAGIIAAEDPPIEGPPVAGGGFNA